MSFRCELCRKPQPNCVQPTKVATEIRLKNYALEGTVGFEVVREKNVCESCVDEVEDVANTHRDKMSEHITITEGGQVVEGLKASMAEVAHA